MSMFKDRVMLFLECINIALRETQSELRKIREEKEIQTTLLRRIAENQTSANKETNKDQEAAPTPKAITWQEAATVLADECAKVSGVDCVMDKCPMRDWCKCARNGNAPQYWVLHIREQEAASDE